MIILRPVDEADIEVFYAHQADPIAAQMAATNARDRADHHVHWTTRVLANPDGVVRTVLVDGVVAGNVLSWIDESGHREIGYRFGREFWGRGIATEAVGAFLIEVHERPIYATVAAHNIGSQRVLEKNGFLRTSDTAEIAPDGIALFEYVLN